MNVARTHRSLIAWMLYGLILFSGLACSIGHGQMLEVFSSTVQSMDCSDHHGASAPMHISKMADHGLIMKLSMSDCAFAGTLTFSLMFFIGLLWLMRAPRLRLHIPFAFCRRTSCHDSPGLIPQAP